MGENRRHAERLFLQIMQISVHGEIYAFWTRAHAASILMEKPTLPISLATPPVGLNMPHPSKWHVDLSGLLCPLFDANYPGERLALFLKLFGRFVFSLFGLDSGSFPCLAEHCRTQHHWGVRTYFRFYKKFLIFVFFASHTNQNARSLIPV